MGVWYEMSGKSYKRAPGQEQRFASGTIAQLSSAQTRVVVFVAVLNLRVDFAEDTTKSLFLPSLTAGLCVCFLFFCQMFLPMLTTSSMSKMSVRPRQVKNCTMKDELLVQKIKRSRIDVESHVARTLEGVLPFAGSICNISQLSHSVRRAAHANMNGFMCAAS